MARSGSSASKSKGGASGKKGPRNGKQARHKEEIAVSKSPAEFFAENQAIAGFDNMGKSLYTTLRELIENSLDACESVNVLPDISVRVEELTQEEFNIVRGLSSKSKIRKRSTAGKGGDEEGEDSDSGSDTGVRDAGLFAKKTKKRKSVSGVGRQSSGNEEVGTLTSDSKNADNDPGSSNKKRKRKAREEAYFRIIVRDNGCGMAHDAIPNLLGRVLSGSKYGVRQTRGKFGLGAKMALIWSKKSTGVPIRIKTSHMLGGRDSGGEAGENVSTCVLDIDIYKNRPRVLEHSQRSNKEGWVGTEFEVLIAGNWTNYKSRIVQYLQQLAIITPYAKLELHYANASDPKKDMTIRYDRRSEQMPPPAKEVKHHPSSVNNLLVQQLLERTKCKTFVKFLSTDLSSVSPALAKRLVAELGNGFEESMSPADVNDKQITCLVQLLRSVELFKSPDGSCLSPLGEYNLNLGIRKVIEPDVVATARDKPSAYEGHPFIVEAAVSLGGTDAKEGLTVVRFANRIPLLFEGGADVATRVAQSKIKWSSYKIDHKRDKIGVFVSIVSTKVPFKGTGKEYIGDDITEIQISVKRALQNCCQQLRAHLTKRNALRDQRERKSRLVKYVPDVSRSIFGILDSMRKRKLDEVEGIGRVSSPRKAYKRAKHVEEESATDIIEKLDSNEISENAIEEHLIEAIESQGMSADGADVSSSGVGQESGAGRGGTKPGGLGGVSQPMYLVPLFDLQDEGRDVHHSLFTFRPMKPLSLWPVDVD